MSKVFITGDRQIAPIYVPLVYMEMLRTLGAGNTISTGTNGGVEMLVRTVAEQTGVTVEVVEQNTLDNGKPDWDTRHAALTADEDVLEVLAVHADPFASSVVKSVMAHADDKMRLVGLADLIG